MGGYGDVQCIDENGIRLDGRTKDEVRPVHIETGVVPVADGSARMTWGLNDVIAAVYGPMEAHPRKIQRQDRAVLDVRYNMAPFSTTDRIRPGFNRRSREISKVTAEALESVVLTELYPRSKIRVEIEIICAEAGTRCAGITAASVALAHAGIPMSDMVVSVASGKVHDIVVCDLNKEEDNYGEADLPMGILPNSGELVFLQMDGDLSPDQFQEAWDYNMEAALILANNEISMGYAKKAVDSKYHIRVDTFLMTTDFDKKLDADNEARLLTSETWLAASLSYDPTTIEILLSSAIDAVGANVPNRVLTTLQVGALPITGTIQNR